jgi:hypothetical protein
MFSVVQNFGLPFWKLSAFVCQIEISEILNYFTLTLTVATALPLDGLRRLMPLVGIAAHSIVVQFRLMSCNQVSGYRDFAQYYFCITFPEILFCLPV